MKDNPIPDISLIGAGVSAPLWLAPLSAWVQLVLAIVMIALGLVRIYTLIRKKD